MILSLIHILLVILCTIFGVLLHTTHANLERESVDMITAVAADPCLLYTSGGSIRYVGYASFFFLVKVFSFLNCYSSEFYISIGRRCI